MLSFQIILYLGHLNCKKKSYLFDINDITESDTVPTVYS